MGWEIPKSKQKTKGCKMLNPLLSFHYSVFFAPRKKNFLFDINLMDFLSLRCGLTLCDSVWTFSDNCYTRPSFHICVCVVCFSIVIFLVLLSWKFFGGYFLARPNWIFKCSQTKCDRIIIKRKAARKIVSNPDCFSIKKNVSRNQYNIFERNQRRR